jgi:hypothetical protein
MHNKIIFAVFDSMSSVLSGLFFYALTVLKYEGNKLEFNIK